MTRFWHVMVALVVLAGTSFAGDFKRIAELTANGAADAKEVSVNRKVSKVRIACKEGEVIINTLVVRRGSEVDRHTVAHKFKPDEKMVIDIGKKVDVTGFRISDDGKGVYYIAVED